jgi:uncharacterized protein YjbJ (UPF0337 family)
MNKDQIAGKWDELKGRAKIAYGELTDDDFMRADGSQDKLYGIIQQRFGDAKERIIEKLNKANMNDRPS